MLLKRLSYAQDVVCVGTDAGLLYHRLQYVVCAIAVVLDAIVAVAHVCMHFASGYEFLMYTVHYFLPRHCCSVDNITANSNCSHLVCVQGKSNVTSMHTKPLEHWFLCVLHVVRACTTGSCLCNRANRIQSQACMTSTRQFLIVVVTADTVAAHSTLA